MKNTKVIFENCKQELDEAKEEFKGSPEGHLGIKQTTYYQIIKKKHIGITKNKSLIRQLCRKRYLQERIAQLENNISKPISEFDYRTPSELINSLPKAYLTVPDDYFYHPSIAAWKAETPKENTINPENLIYSSNDKIQFRSIAERSIAEQLDNYGLPYRYDTVIKIYGKEVSPDFIIRNPYTGRSFIWEHFGAFHEEKYEESMNKKMDLYLRKGLIPSVNLISTYGYHIRDTRRIKKIIEEIIL